MNKAKTRPTRILKSGKGRTTMLQEQDDETVVLAFRRPIEREHVANGCLIKNAVSRDGTKRVVALALDDSAAETAYQLLKGWHDRRARMRFWLPFLLYAMSSMHRRPFLSRFWR